MKKFTSPDFRLALRCVRDLLFSLILRNVERQLRTDISGQPIDSSLGLLDPWRWDGKVVPKRLTELPFHAASNHGRAQISTITYIHCFCSRCRHIRKADPESYWANPRTQTEPRVPVNRRISAGHTYAPRIAIRFKIQDRFKPAIRPLVKHFCPLSLNLKNWFCKHKNWMLSWFQTQIKE
jgi:hypothetical protein